MKVSTPTAILTTKEILKLHEELEIQFGDGNDGDFLFGWQSINPFAGSLLMAVQRRAESIDYTKYSYMESDAALAEGVIDLHNAIDGVKPEDVFCAGSGGTCLLFAFSYWLARNDIREVYYLPPVYFTLLNGLRQFGIHARALTGYHSFEKEFQLRLPTKRTVLMFADPVWYAGIPVPEDVVQQVAKWQELTGSLVFVDGSFQYMRWDHQLYEPTAMLDPLNTIRLVSPTKSLVIHGYRFAYSIVPRSVKAQLANCYSNISGPSTAINTAFAYEAIQAMRERKLTEQLITRAASRHANLRTMQRIESPLTPKAGYFVFEKINVPLPGNALRMDGRYFGQPRFPHHARMNLLSTKFYLLEE
jgi:aspartate/methionine/tyrosine aminotransferase